MLERVTVDSGFTSGSALYSSKEEVRTLFSLSRYSSCTSRRKGCRSLLKHFKNGGLKFIPFLKQKDTRFTPKMERRRKLKMADFVLVVDSPSKLGDAYDIDLMLRC